jgi:hypothetical protein
VRWQEVFSGVDEQFLAKSSTENQYSRKTELLPEIHRIARLNGLLVGSDGSKVFVSSPSTVSLPGYSELFAGRSPRCSHNECPGTDDPTLLDTWHDRDPKASMAVVSSWSKIPLVAAKNGSHLIVSAGRKTIQNLQAPLADREFSNRWLAGNRTTAFPGTADYRPDRYTGEVGLRLLELLRPQFLFLGLGDTDEHAHAGNYPAYLDALNAADAIVGRIDRWLEARRAEGKRTLLVVTTDHGRADTFQHHGNAKEAARIWTLWSGDPVRGRGYPNTEDSRLADVAATLRELLALEPDTLSGAGHSRYDFLSSRSPITTSTPLRRVALHRSQVEPTRLNPSTRF